MKYSTSVTLIALMIAGETWAAQPARSKPKQTASAVQSFTYANVVSYFKSTGLRTTQVQKRCTIFFEGEWKDASRYDYGVIIVENSDEDVQVTFYLTDAHEMNWVTEFLDAPFFTPSETQALFGLMNSRREAREHKVGRFQRVDFHRWKPRHAEIIVFSLTPGRG